MEFITLFAYTHKSGLYPVSGEHLGPVLVDDLDNAGRLDPGLSVHLHGNALLPQDGDLHLSALRCNTAESAGRWVSRM